MRPLRPALASGRMLGLVLVAALAMLRVADPLPLQTLRNFAFDTFQRWKPRVETAYPVRIVDIDEKSLKRSRPMALAAHGAGGSDHAAR